MAGGGVLVAGRVLSVTDGLLPGTKRTNSASRAQNRGFCAFLAFRTLVFGLFEHKIGIFVRFLPSGPPLFGFSSTKSWFLCAFGVWNPRFQAFRAQNRGFCAREEVKVASGSVKWPSCKSPRTLSKCKYLITNQLTFEAVLGELKLMPPRTLMCPRRA